MTPYTHISSNKFKTYLIFVIFTLIFSGFFFIIGKVYDDPWTYALLGLVISLGSSIGSYFFSDKIVLSTTRARVATKEEFFDFYTVTENLSMAAGLPMPKLYVIDDPSPNAFATGRDPKHAVVCATTGLLGTLERSEIEGVIAHELAHVKNYDILVMTIAAVLVGSISLVADIVMRSLWWRGGDDDRRNTHPALYILFILALILTPIVAMLIQLAISRQREYLADASGALLTRYPEGLASALEKISSYPSGVASATTSTSHLFIANPFRKGQISSVVANLFSTHPSIEKRIQILRSM